MKEANFILKWPTEHQYLSIYAHELSRYSFHWHDTEYEINIVLRGRGEYCCEGRLQVLAAGDVIVLNCNEGHGSFALEPGTVALVLRFPATAFKDYVSSSRGFLFHCMSTEATRNAPGFRKIRYFVSQILEAAMADNTYSRLTVNAAMGMLISTLCNFFPPTTVSVVRPRDEMQQKAIQTIMKYIEKHYSYKVTLDDLAHITQYNRTYVSTFFKNNIGINFYDYLVRVRLSHALHDFDYVKCTPKNLTEIAIDNGFPDLKTFNQRFRDIFHMYPAEYRALATHVTPRKVYNERRYCTEDNPALQEKLAEYLWLHQLEKT